MERNWAWAEPQTIFLVYARKMRGSRRGHNLKKILALRACNGIEVGVGIKASKKFLARYARMNDYYRDGYMV